MARWLALKGESASAEFLSPLHWVRNAGFGLDAIVRSAVGATGIAPEHCPRNRIGTTVTQGVSVSTGSILWTGPIAGRALECQCSLLCCDDSNVNLNPWRGLADRFDASYRDIS